MQVEVPVPTTAARTVFRVVLAQKMDIRVAPQLAAELSRIPEISDVEIDCYEAVSLDTAIAQLLLVEARQRHAMGRRLILRSINPALQSRLRLVGLDIYCEEASPSLGGAAD